MAGGTKTKKRKRRSLKRKRISNYGNEKRDCRVAVFQDYTSGFVSPRTPVSDGSTTNGADGDNTPTDPASVFFELANSPLVGYRVDDKMLVVRQDSDCEIHTGGIVWETSYLLAEYLSAKFGGTKTQYLLGKTLEIGAGCGMLGLILATSGLSSKVVLTEASEVMKNLKHNVEANLIQEEGRGDGSDDDSTTQKTGVHGSEYLPLCPSDGICVRQLRWDHLDEDTDTTGDLEPHSFDTIVGTDVVFSPALVRPLLETIQRMAKKYSKDDDENNRQSLIYLCLQIRCPDSHALLFSEAHSYGLEVIDVTQELSTVGNDYGAAKPCAWGLELECVLLKINAIPTKRKKSKDRDRKTSKSDKKSKTKKNRAV